MSLNEFLATVEPQFNQLNQHQMNFAKECSFAKQQLLKNDYTMQTASNNKLSLQSAIANVAAIGISLNPANQHAFLVPRDGAICLDISYRGLIKLATDTGVIKWARAQCVYEHDHFVYHGPAKEPEYTSDPFVQDKGEFRGVYCIAKTVDGDILAGAMSAADIYQVRDTSMAYTSAVRKNKTNSVWHQWFDEMAKKTVIKREYKTWPQSDGRERLDKAIEVLNEHEGIEQIEHSFFDDDKYEQFRTLVKSDDKTGLYALQYASTCEEWVALTGAYLDTAPRGQKGAFKENIKQMCSDGADTLETIAADLEELQKQSDDSGISEIMQELTEQEKNVVIEFLDPQTKLVVSDL